ncbi:ATP-binding protein [Methylobacter sp. YRD-M1]|uniref:ATP-binding protein n=1 Tax=Methylobacter sp. YRD-M1 TaxID=2911520 RepID=UPI00227A55CF|nr:ATP-binding protein [Methylobacter sp. YRD-M1]WAK02777.1 AAA family ATPase [Methylobacter sp. YRD-M1]
MVDNDTFTYHLKKSASRPVDTTARSLITQERTQKLELLTHLLANLTQPLIICGPEGIGKTTLLKVLQERKVDSWLYCPIQGNADLSFEKIQEHMAKAITQDKSDKHGLALAAAFGQLEVQKRKVILTIDNAGQLVPGLVTTIIQYAASNPAVRVVFVLTHDELHIKSRSDRAIDNCYFIEIPPLSEKQCGEFLQYLSTQPRAQVSFNAINDNMVEAIYKETHGIPGKIIAELPALASNPKSGGNAKWILPAAVVALIAVAFSVQWMSSHPRKEDNASTSSSADQKQIAIEIAPPSAVTSNESVKNGQPVQPVPQQQKPVNEKTLTQPEMEDVLDDSEALDTPEAAEEMDAVPPDQDMENRGAADDIQPINGKPGKPEISDKKKNVEDAIAASKEKPAAKPVAQESEKQTANGYTLQLMVLSKQQSVADVLKKYPSLGIKQSRKITNGKELYVLMYGSFSSAAQAIQARNSLPPEFRNAIPVKVGAIK